MPRFSFFLQNIQSATSQLLLTMKFEGESFGEVTLVSFFLLLQRNGTPFSMGGRDGSLAG